MMNSIEQIMSNSVEYELRKRKRKRKREWADNRVSGSGGHGKRWSVCVMSSGGSESVKRERSGERGLQKI